MRPLRIVAIIAGCLLLVPAVAMLLGGAALGLGHAFGRDADGFFETTIQQIQTGTVAVVAEELDLSSDPAGPSWILDRLDPEIRLIVEDSANAMFIGIAPNDDVDAYLAGVAHNEIVEIGDGLAPVYRYRDGSATVAPPGSEDFWVVAAEGNPPLPLSWDPVEGSWTVVLMNSDGSAGVLADVNVGVRADFVLPAALILLAAGTILTPITIGFIIYGTTSEDDLAPRDEDDHLSLSDIGHRLAPHEPQPVVLEASLDPELSHWKWMVKWLLAIPHFIVLLFLWLVFALLTTVAAIAILLFGRFPHAIFRFNVGVMRWSWRVSYYATSGGLGTDRYPPFSLKAQPHDLATFDVAYPAKLSRTLVLVKWWLLAIPHYLIVAILVGDLGWVNTNGTRLSGVSLLGLLCLFAGVSLLFTGTYPRALFDLIIGLNRWIYRVLAYAALMTDSYPPFRLDQGGKEPPAHGQYPTAAETGGAIDPADQQDRSPEQRQVTS